MWKDGWNAPSVALVPVAQSGRVDAGTAEVGMTRGAVAWRYDRAERIADAIVHASGLVLAAIGVAVLLVATAAVRPVGDIAAAGIYGAGLILGLTASFAYNAWPVTPTKWLLRRLDHSAIFVLIAATYTPLLAGLPRSATTVGLLAGIWTVAAAGVALKCLAPGRWDRLTILLYLALGWSGIAILPTLIEGHAAITLALIVAGGLVYSAGVPFHLWDGLRFQNAVWHGFVVAGAALHWAAVYSALVLSPAA